MDRSTHPLLSPLSVTNPLSLLKQSRSRQQAKNASVGGSQHGWGKEHRLLQRSGGRWQRQPHVVCTCMRDIMTQIVENCSKHKVLMIYMNNFNIEYSHRIH